MYMQVARDHAYKLFLYYILLQNYVFVEKLGVDTLLIKIWIL